MLEAAFAPHVDSYRGYTPASLYNRTLRWGAQPGVPGRAVARVRVTVRVRVRVRVTITARFMVRV